MRPFKRKSRLQQLTTSVKKDLPGWPSEKAVKRGLIAVGGLAGLTAGSAGISSFRQRSEEAEEDS
ncbi:MAG TPA: hypothetical protein VKB03_01540 [Conexibacter sp.]|nr:hypothetical protein [Conexibacter sp.]